MSEISIDFNRYYPTPHVIQTYMEILGVFKAVLPQIPDSLEPSTVKNSPLYPGKFSSEII